MRQLLIISHAPSNNTIQLSQAVLNGSTDKNIVGVQATWLNPLDATADDVLNAHALIIGSTENFGYMNGLLKDFFERIYYPCLEKTQGLPYCLFIKAGNDGLGAQTSIEKITTGLRWRKAQPALIMRGTFQDQWIDDCSELGMAMASGLEMGVF